MKTKDMQTKDQFKDLIKTRNSAILESTYLFGGTKVNIRDFAPKPKKVYISQTTRRILRRSRAIELNEIQDEEYSEEDKSIIHTQEVEPAEKVQNDTKSFEIEQLRQEIALLI